jgi:hypothetical protein
MTMEFKNSNENKEKSLNEIAKEVNAMLDPIIEKTFNLKARKEYILANESDLNEDQQEITDRAENLGLSDDFSIDKKMGEDILKAYSKYEKTEKIIKDIRPDTLLPFTLSKEIKKIDKDKKLEEKIAEVYGFSKKINGWDSFILILSICLRENPFYWDSFKKKSESQNSN